MYNSYKIVYTCKKPKNNFGKEALTLDAKTKHCRRNLQITWSHSTSFVQFWTIKKKSYKCNSTEIERYLGRFSLGTPYALNLVGMVHYTQESQVIHRWKEKDLYITVHKISFVQPRNHLLLPTQGAFFKYPYLCAQYWQTSALSQIKR